MQIGLHALGIGAGARRDVIDAVAGAAEGHGFSRLWAGEHVVMVDEPQSGATTRIGLATGVVLLPASTTRPAGKRPRASTS